MALNEHKNLDGDNLHVPKGFTAASNSSVLTKNSGGTVEWVPLATTGFGQVITFKLQGYSTSNEGLTYEYGQNLTDGQTPFEMAADYGNTTVGAATIAQKDIFRVGQGHIIPSNITLSLVTGWLTGSLAGTVTLALCKVTPSDSVATALTPVLLDEIVITSAGNTRTRQIDESDFTVSTLSAGDILFPMIKADAASNILYFNITIQAIITAT
jgi:hypothetical protein